MAFCITAIKEIINNSKEQIHIVKRENPEEDNIVMSPGEISYNEIWIPWVKNDDDFNKKVIDICLVKSGVHFYIWQDDVVYFSTSGFKQAKKIPGNNTIDGDRKLNISLMGWVELFEY